MQNIAKIIQEIVRHEMQKLRIGELGVVTSIFPHTDPEDDHNYECNVKLKNYTINDTELELRKVPIATGMIGNAAVPNVGDLVLLSFVQGNINQPIVIARLYNDEDRPPVHQAQEIIHRLPLAAEDNETVKLELRNIAENDPPRECLLEMADKIKIQVIDHTIVTQVDKTKITIAQEGDDDGCVNIESGGSKVVINQDGDIEISSEGNLVCKSKGDFTLEAANISLKSEQACALESGTEMTMKSGTDYKQESTAAFEIKSSATMKVESSATMDIKGAIVNIN